MIGRISFPMRKGGRLRRALVPALLIAAVLLADAAGWMASADRIIADLRARPVRYAPTGSVVLVDIDPKSIEEIGVWPWPRSIHGDLLTAANSLGAHRVAFDIDFSSRTNDRDDAAFAAALASSVAATFLASFAQTPSTDEEGLAVSWPIAAFLEVSWPAGVNLPLDPDGRARLFASHVETGAETLTAMPSLLADREIDGRMIGINYAIEASALLRVSYVDLLENRVDPALIAGKTLIVGATALELRDFFLVPVHGVVSGSTIIALATETLLQNRELRAAAMPYMALLLLAALLIIASNNWRPRRSVAFLLGLAVAVELIGFVLFHAAGLSVRTAVAIAILGALALLILLREFGLRKLLAAVSLAEARNSRRILDQVVETGFDGIVIIDARGRVIRANPAARRMPLGRVASEPITFLEDLPYEVQAIVREMRKAGGTGDRADRTFDIAIETRSGTKDRSAVLELSVAPLELVSLDAVNRKEDAVDHFCLTFRDVTQTRRSQEALTAMALQDPLTSLPNRRALELALENARRSPTASCALLIFDLDRFKNVNDTLGHAVGDEVLIEVGRRAAAVLAHAGTVARMGGDEFAAVFAGSDAQTANALALALSHAIDQPFFVNGHRVSTGTSIGIACSRRGDWEIDGLVRHADLALNAAKASMGETRIVFFDPHMEEARLARLDLENALLHALDREQLEIFYQPQVNSVDGSIIGAEALLRWRHPDKGYISPAVFVPVAEETGLIHAIGGWVMKTACRDAATWPCPIRVAVNVSSIQFDAGDLVAVTDAALEASGLPANRLEIEITESAFVRESDHLASTFAALRARGIGFALDDFGTGYSSLGYLHRFPITKIKIDRQFVSGLPDDQSSMAIVRSIMALSHGLSIRTIAEGAETQGQIEALRMLGCREIQGYAYHRPMADGDLRSLLVQQAGQEPAILQALG